MSKYLMEPEKDTFREWLNEQMDTAMKDQGLACSRYEVRYHEGRFHAFEEALYEYETSREVEGDAE